MNASRFATAATLLALTGCIPAYVGSTRDDAAYLSLVSKSASIVNVHGFANAKECRNQLNLAGSGDLKGKTDIRIPPDEEFTVLAMLNDPNRVCHIALTFRPKPREFYTALIEGSGSRCGMAIVRTDVDHLVAEPSVRKRDWSRPFFSDSEAQCK